jgi:hypothetical protein
MWKVLSNGLAVFTGVVCMPLVVSPLQMHKTPVPEFRSDQRLETLRNFFEQSGCPARDYAHVFLEASDAYNLDWRLLPSLSYVESTGGKAAPGNNLFGWDNGRARFPTPAAGIHEVGYQLSHASMYRAKDLDQLLATYNPNDEYIERVKSVMRQISPSE